MEPASTFKRVRSDDAQRTPQRFSNEALDRYLENIEGPVVNAIVVGSGVGGLTAASLLAQSGLSVIVLERSTKCGGATHTFREGQFQFEMGIQDIGAEVWLGDKSKEGPAQVLHAASQGGIRWIHIDSPGVPQHCVVVGDQRAVGVYMPWVRHREYLVNRFPSEAAAIDRYYAEVQETRKLAVDFMFSRLPKEDTPQGERRSHEEGARLFLTKASHTVDEVLSGLTKNVELKYLLTYLWSKCGLPPNVASWVAHCLTAGQYLEGIAFPESGGGGIENGIVPVIYANGGAVFIEAGVHSVVVQNGICTGVQMDDGRVIQAQRVVSNVGAANTFERLVKRENSEYIRVPLNVIRDLKWSSYAIIQVFLGFEGNADSLGVTESSYWFLPKSMDHTDNAVKYFLDSSFTSDFPYVHLTFPTAKSKTASNTTACIFAASHYDWFKDMQPEDIKAVADEIVGRLTEKLWAHFPQLKAHVKFIELATPLAHEFHLGAARGAPLGLGHTPQRFFQEWLRPTTAIEGLILSGQDVYSCGVANAAVGGFMGAAAAFPNHVLPKFRKLFEKQ